MQITLTTNYPLIYVLVRSWNTFDLFDKCINSILGQTYKNFKILFVDDASDYTRKQKDYIVTKLTGHSYIFNTKRRFSVFNGFHALEKFADKTNSIVFVLDADDSLLNNKVFEQIVEVYNKQGVLFTYGSNLFNNPLNNKPEIFSPFLNTEYPSVVKKHSLYRKDPFRVFHPMTFTLGLFRKIDRNAFMERPGLWFKYCFDLCTFLPMLEMANGKYAFIRKKLYLYNTQTSLANIKVNPYEFVREDLLIRSKKPYDAIY